MLEIGVELVKRDPAYEDLATKFMEQFLWIGRAMNGVGPDGMWDEEDGFYYDVLRLPDGRSMRLKVRSMVGLLPSVPSPSSSRRSGNGFRTSCGLLRNVCGECRICSTPFTRPGLAISA